MCVLSVFYVGFVTVGVAGSSLCRCDRADVRSVENSAEKYSIPKFCFTVHFNSLDVTHQLIHFQYNNILV